MGGGVEHFVPGAEFARTAAYDADGVHPAGTAHRGAGIESGTGALRLSYWPNRISGEAPAIERVEDAECTPGKIGRIQPHVAGGAAPNCAAAGEGHSSPEELTEPLRRGKSCSTRRDRSSDSDR